MQVGSTSNGSRVQHSLSGLLRKLFDHFATLELILVLIDSSGLGLCEKKIEFAAMPRKNPRSPRARGVNEDPSGESPPELDAPLSDELANVP